MLTFNLKKEWFEKIKSGEKTHEYREAKQYWTKRFLNVGYFLVMPYTPISFLLYEDECEFVCGYPPKNDKDKRLKGKIKSIKLINGKNTDVAIDKDVYDIEFELLED